MSPPHPSPRRAQRVPRPRANLAHLLQIVFGWGLFQYSARFLYRARVRRQRGFSEAVCIYAANHRSFLDPPFLSMWLRRPLVYFARADLWRVPIIGHMLRIMGGIPVERSAPTMQTMKLAVDTLRGGQSLLVFPEGTRTRTGRLGTLREGPALFARRAGVNVVPVYVHRTERIWPRGHLLPGVNAARLEVRFGAPLVAPANLPPREQDAWVMNALEAWMRQQERELLGAEPAKTDSAAAPEVA